MKKSTKKKASKKGTVTRKKKPREKQKLIEGTEPPTLEDVEAAALDYEETRDERMELTEREVEAQAKLTEVMRKHGLEKYEFNERVVTCVHADEWKSKVRKKKSKQE